MPKSVNLWLEAASLETNVNQKKIVLRRALEIIPNSVKLWKMAIQLENVADARIMLARAVECVPHSIEMWLALAKLETYENARKVLNNAREANPTEHATWITASKLEEAHGNGHMAAKIIEKMMASLTQYRVVISRDIFIKEAEGPADLKSSEELSGTISISEALLDWCSHWDVSALDVIEEGSECTADSHHSLHEEAVAVI
jgi:pre-mRNA-processing factor 6